jgi:hypothetical protein
MSEMSEKTLTPKPYKPAGSNVTNKRISECDTGEKEMARLSLTDKFKNKHTTAGTRRVLAETTNAQQHLTPSTKGPQKKRAPIAPSPLPHLAQGDEDEVEVANVKDKCKLHRVGLSRGVELRTSIDSGVNIAQAQTTKFQSSR